MCAIRTIKVKGELTALNQRTIQYTKYKDTKRHMVGSLKMNTTLEYSTRVVQEGDRRCKKSTLNDLAYLTPLRIPLMNPALECVLYKAVASNCDKKYEL